MELTGWQSKFLAIKRVVVPLFISVLLSSCANFYKANNEAITAYNLQDSYRLDNHTVIHPIGENLIILAFSGGGTRAAALSYGVMKSLKETSYLDVQGKERRLLEDVDFISSVSGGSFTAAYYAVFGDKLFTDFEDDFLRKSVEGALLSKLLSPSHWLKSLWSGFDRTEMAIDYYDREIFKGATFGDIPLGQRPMVMINATDLSRGRRFVFTQDMFDLLCADLNSFSIARAVTASSAVPVAFPSVVLKNRAGECDLESSPQFQEILNVKDDTIRRKDFLENTKSYLDKESRPYIHLVDGGISDNLGLRALSDRIQVFGINPEKFKKGGVKRVLIVLVNSSVSPVRPMDSRPESPSVGETVAAFTSAMIERLNLETRSMFFDHRNRLQTQLGEIGLDIDIHVAEVSFESIKQKSIKAFFNSLPTSLELKGEEVDSLILAGQVLLNEDVGYKMLLKDLNATQKPIDQTTKESLIKRILPGFFK